MFYDSQGWVMRINRILRIDRIALNIRIEKPSRPMRPANPSPGLGRFPCSCSALLSGALLGGGEALRAFAHVMLSSWSCAALLLAC